MKRYEKIISIVMLCVISLSNVGTPVAYAAEMGKIHLTRFPALHMFVPQGSDAMPKFLKPDHASVLGASTSLLAVGTQELDLRQGNAGSANQRIPIHVQKLEKKVYQTTEDVTFAVINPDNDAFATTVQDVNGKQVNVPITESNNGTTTTVELGASNTIRPGLYKVIVTDGENRTTEQDFTWGVLALNFDKSVYHPKETGDISMAVLNDKGDMVCDAIVKLQITDKELGIDDTLSTTEEEGSANKITINPQCQKHDYSLSPDYEAHYTFGSAGTYTMTLTAETAKGEHTMTDTIQVKDQIPFDVQRTSATRIYPPNTYPMIFNITANRDFSGTVTETVPDNFTITPSTQSATQSYNAMQTVYLNSSDPAALMSQQIASSSGGLVMPFHGTYPITQGFGAQLTDPTLQAFYTHYGLGGHDGIDFGLPMNTPLYAVDEGDVIWSGPGDYGTMVTIQHSWGKTYYGHMSNTSVTVAQHVTKGQLIGYSGMTGEATGPHLHFGMKPNNPDMQNGYYGKIDPMPFLPIGQGEPITALGSLANPVANMVYNTTVLGASDSAATPTPSDVPSLTTTSTPTAEPTVTPTSTQDSSASGSAATVLVTPTPTPAESTDATQATSTPNTNFTVLDREIKLNEQIANSALTQKVKILTWNVKLKKGESTTLGYAYQTPKVSPQFYLLGPAKFYDGGNERVVFQEQRQWQIAADDVGVEWFQDTTGLHNWNGYSWQYRKKLTIDHTKVSATPNMPTTTFMEAGGDATNTDGGTNLTTAANGGGFYQGTTTGAGSTIAADCTLSHTGPCSIKAFSGGSPGTKASVATPALTNTSSGRVEGYFYFDTLPGASGQMPFLILQQSNGNNVIGLEVDGTNETLKFNTIANTNGTTVLQSATWYRVSMSYSITSATVNEFKVYLNGNLEIDLVNTNLGTSTVGDHYRIGNADNSDNNTTMHFDDIYADNGTDLSDPGDIRVTAKLPISDGASNPYTTNGSAGGTACTSGTHCQYINERGVNTTDFLSTATATSSENFTLQGASSGDVDISTASFVADEAWVYADATAGCTASITNNGTNTNITLTTSFKMFTNTVSNAIYPSGNQGVGIQSCSSGTTKLAEAGMQIAYIPNLSLSNFPVLVSLSSDSDLSSNAQASGNDIVFTDSTGRTLLNYEIESYSSGTLVAWVQIPTLSATVDTIIYMYYGNPAASSKASTSTWDSNFKYVEHLGETTACGTSIFNDSTSNGHTGTCNGSGPTVNASGQIGGARTFNGSSQYISMSSSSDFNPGSSSFTASFWIKPANNTADMALLGHMNNDGTGTGFEFYINSGGCSASTGQICFWDGTTDIDIGGGITANTWQYLAYTKVGTTVSAYLNGSFLASATTQSSIPTATQSETVGAALSSSTGQFFNGSIDDVRFSLTARSAGWIATSYNNQNSPSTFATLGSVETDIYAPTLDKLMRHGTWFDSTGNKQPFEF